MDERDCRILVELAKAPFEAYEAIGRRVGVTGTAIKARLDRMGREGIYGGFACGPSAPSLGRHARLAVYGQDAGEVDPAAFLRAPEVAWAARSHPAATVVMLYRDDAEAPIPDGVTRIAGRDPDAIVLPNDPRESARRAPLSPLDWRVMQALMQEPRAPVRALARRAGLSARTVRERRDRLFAQGDLMAFPILDATREEGAILYSAYVMAGSADDLRGVRLANAHRLATHHAPPGAFLVGHVRTYAEAHVVEEKLRATPGVRHVAFSVPQGTVVARERLEAWVEAEVRKWDRARREGRPHSALPSS